MTRQLLSFSRRQATNPCPIELNFVLADLDKMLRRLIGEDIELTSNFGSDVYTILADTGQIEQIVVNLVVNARDAMRSGGSIKVQTSNREVGPNSAEGIPPGSYALLSVTDNGSGIEPKTLTRIFEPFFTTKAAGKGTGLGLSTVFGIVQQNGGHIRVRSEMKKGTTFDIYLPRTIEIADAPVSSRRRSVIPETGTILLVEDDESVRSVAHRILSRLGYVVLEASSPNDAHHLATQHAGKIDLLLTDVVLPDARGPELAAQLSNKHPQLRVLFMSGYPDPLSVLELQAMSTPLLTKPFTPASLTERVREALNSIN